VISSFQAIQLKHRSISHFPYACYMLLISLLDYRVYKSMTLHLNTVVFLIDFLNDKTDYKVSYDEISGCLTSLFQRNRLHSATKYELFYKCQLGAGIVCHLLVTLLACVMSKLTVCIIHFKRNYVFRYIRLMSKHVAIIPKTKCYLETGFCVDSNEDKRIKYDKT
jgi:hypothetical protein